MPAACRFPIARAATRYSAWFGPPSVRKSQFCYGDTLEAEARDYGRMAPPSSSTPTYPETAPFTINPLDVVIRLVKSHVHVSDEQRLVIALWILHTFVFDKFLHTPRLALLSPVRGCGKTSLLALIELMVDEPFRLDEFSLATIYHRVDEQPGTVC
jgi:hypothetical protein